VGVPLLVIALFAFVLVGLVIAFVRQFGRGRRAR
jgi:hypothetical protein